MNTETNEIISSVETVETDKNSVEVSKTKKETKTKKEEVPSEPQLKIEANKIVLNKSLADLLEAKPNDRICISYLSGDSGYFPVISKSGIFNDNEAGNKLTKSLTSSFRGKQLEMLQKYGECFQIQSLDTLPKCAFKLLDPNYKVLETIKEDELAPMPKAEEIEVKEDLDLNLSESLEESNDFINFDFDFNNI